MLKQIYLVLNLLLILKEIRIFILSYKNDSLKTLISDRVRILRDSLWTIPKITLTVILINLNKFFMLEQIFHCTQILIRCLRVQKILIFLYWTRNLTKLSYGIKFICILIACINVSCNANGINRVTCISILPQSYFH